MKSDAQELWRSRFGHIDRNLVRRMPIQRAATGIKLTLMPSIPKVICEPCVEGNHTRSPMKSRVSTPIARADVTNSDVCGPFPIQSISGARYFVTFVNAHGGYVHVNFMRTKDEMVKWFPTFERCFQRNFEHQVKVPYSDNRGEYQAPSGYLTANRIEWEPTDPDTLQNNGLEELISRMIRDMVRTMLAQSGLPPSFYGEAVATAVSTRDMITLSNSIMKTPEEFVSDTRPSVHNLRTFGCQVWFMDSTGKKNDPRGRRDILLCCRSHRNLEFGI